MALPRLYLILAGLSLAFPATAQSVFQPASLALKVTPGDDAALKADAGVNAPIKQVQTALTFAVDTHPATINDPLATSAMNASHESLGFNAAWSAAERAGVSLTLNDALAQTWAPQSLFSAASHEINTDQARAKLELALKPYSDIELDLSGDAGRNAVRDVLSDPLHAQTPSLFSTQTAGGAATLKWRLTPWFSLDAKARVDSTDAGWRGQTDGAAADMRVAYSDVEPSVTGVVTLPWSGDLSLGYEHAVSPVDPGLLANYAAVQDHTPGDRFDPEREWRCKLSFTQPLIGDVKLNAALVQAQIENTTELGPAGAGQQGPVNIYGGQRQEADLSLQAPLDAFGLSSVTLTGRGAWRDSEVRDPFTGELRRASAEVPRDASLGVVQALADQHARWGLEGHFGGDQTVYQMSQITQIRVADSVGGFVEYRPGPFAVRLQVDGLLGGDRTATDLLFAAPRGTTQDNPIDRVDVHAVGGQAVRLILRKTL